MCTKKKKLYKHLFLKKCEIFLKKEIPCQSSG